MPIYEARIFDSATNRQATQTLKGSEAQVRSNLKKRGFSILSLTKKEGKTKRLFNFSPKKQMPLPDLIIFCRSMAIMLRAGFNTGEALQFYAQTVSETQSKALRSAADQILGGDPIDAVFDRSGLFDATFSGVMNAGHKAGALANAFDSLGTRYKTQKNFLSQVRKAVAIPVIVITIMTAMFLIAQIFLVPMVEKLLHDSRLDPDAFSSVVFSLSHVVNAVWIPVLLGISTFIIFFWFSDKFRQTVVYVLMSRWKALRLVIMGLRQLSLISTLRVLYSSGVGLLESLKLSANVLKGSSMREEVLEAAEEYRSGVSLATALRNHTSCDERMIHMIHVSEDSDLKSQLANLEEMYTEDTAETLDRLSTKINLLAYATASLLIGTVFASAYTPIILMSVRMAQMR